MREKTFRADVRSSIRSRRHLREKRVPARLENVTKECRNTQVLAGFWAAALGYEVEVDQPKDLSSDAIPPASLPTLSCTSYLSPSSSQTGFTWT